MNWKWVVSLILLVSSMVGANSPLPLSESKGSPQYVQDIGPGLKNPFVNDSLWYGSLSTWALVRLWVWENRRQLEYGWRFSYPRNPLKVPKALVGEIASRTPGANPLWFDYRETSYYESRTVREVINLQSGRYKYFPTLNLFQAAQWASRAFQKYRNLLFQRKGFHLLDSPLDSLEFYMLDVLWATSQGYTAAEWYQKFVSFYPQTPVVFPGFQKKIDDLLKKRYITRKGNAPEPRYYPAMDRQELAIRVREALLYVDPVFQPEKYYSLRTLQKMLED